MEQASRCREDYWKQRFDTLVDKSDSMILLLKTELKDQVDEFKGQFSSNWMGGDTLITSVKTEPQDDITMTQPKSIANLSSIGNKLSLKGVHYLLAVWVARGNNVTPTTVATIACSEQLHVRYLITYILLSLP